MSTVTQQSVTKSQTAGAVQRTLRPHEPTATSQREVSNQAMQQLLRTRSIQPKLTVNTPGDQFEQEADRVADQVMRMSVGSVSASPPHSPGVQRVCDECEEEIQRKESTHAEPALVQQRAISNQATQRIMRRANVERAPVGLPCVLTTERTGAVDANVLFDLSVTALDPAGRRDVAAFVQRRTAAGTSGRIRIDGYASVDGPEALNWRLSCGRAISVRDELITLGIAPQDIVILAHGETSEFSRSHAPNRRATIRSIQPVGPMPALRGPAFLQTPASTASPLPADTIRTWRALTTHGDFAGALRAVVWAMEQRGEIDFRLLRTQAATHPAVCTQLEPIALDPTLSSALTTPCGCLGTTGNRTPNPRIRIPPIFVTHNPFASGTPAQTGAEVLHSTLIHEFRHVVQEYEKCNGITTSRGICTDCNSPGEMDSYLTEIEAGYDSSTFRHAWVRVFVNQDFLSVSQRATFQARIDAAEQKINRMFPGVDWTNDPDVLRTRAFCNRLGPSPPHIGDCTELERSGGGTP